MDQRDSMAGRRPGDDDSDVPDDAAAEPTDLPGEANPPDASVSGEERVVADLLERETAYGLLQRGKALMSRRHFAQASVLLERAARLEPRRGSILEALGRAYYNSGQHQRAADVFGDLLGIDPALPYAQFALGQSLKHLGRPDEARTHLRLAVALAPGSRLYRDALARLGGNRPPAVL